MITIRKYEVGACNPKPEQLLKIANALGLSINIFIDFDIKTVADVLSLIFKIDEKVDMKFLGKKNKEGIYNPNPITLKFNNLAINRKLATWVRTKDLVQKTVNDRDEFENDEVYNAEVTEMKEKAEVIKQSLVDDNIIVTRSSNINIKMENN